MTEMGNATASAAAVDTMTARAGRTTGAVKASGEAGSRGIRWIRQLCAVNLGLVALQAISAGFFLSGYGVAVVVHRDVALVLQAVVLLQAVVAVVLWRRGRIPASLAGLSVGLLVMVFLQVGLGFRKVYWLHVPIGVGLFGGLTRQMNR
jgi:heme A synthase